MVRIVSPGGKQERIIESFRGSSVMKPSANPDGSLGMSQIIARLIFLEISEKYLPHADPHCYASKSLAFTAHPLCACA